MQRFGTTTRGFMIAVAIIALVLRFPEPGMLILLLVLACVAIRCLLDSPTGSRSWARSYLVTIACLYLPFGWLVVQDYPWDSYRWYWIKMWPILPGLCPAILCLSRYRSAMEFALPIFTALLIALFAWLGSFGRWALAGSSTIVLILSIFMSWASYQVFLF